MFRVLMKVTNDRIEIMITSRFDPNPSLLGHLNEIGLFTRIVLKVRNVQSHGLRCI